MSAFKKVAIHQLSKTNAKLMKRNKKPTIQILNELNLSSHVKSALEKILPDLDKIHKSSLDNSVKKALINELLLTADRDASLATFQTPLRLISTPKEKNTLMKPPSSTLDSASKKARLTSTPVKKAPEYLPMETPQFLRQEESFEYPGEVHELLPLIPEFYNKKHEVIDTEGEAYPYSDINRVLSFVETPYDGPIRKGPPGTKEFLDQVGTLGHKLSKISGYIRNNQAVKRVMDKTQRLIEKDERSKKTQKGLGWTSLGIRY